MTPMFKRVAIAAASLAMLTTTGIAAQFVAVPKAAGSGAAINCSVPNSVVCTISSARGVKSVKISANTPQGTIYLVDNTYRCPRSVKVSWDSAYQASGTQIVECGGFGLKTN